MTFEFLGYEFRPRFVKGTAGKIFLGFVPAISPKAAKSIRRTMRGWSLHRRSDLSLNDIARRINPVIRGWIDYYGSYYRSALYPVFRFLNAYLSRWVMMKYKGYRKHRKLSREWIRRVECRQATLFAHWTMLSRTTG